MHKMRILSSGGSFIIITLKLQSEACTLLDLRAMFDRVTKDYGGE